MQMIADTSSKKTNAEESTVVNAEVEIAIVGAGLVGMAAAIAMHDLGYSVTLLDSQPPNACTKHWDTRIYAISPNNVKWLQGLGVWQCVDMARVAEMQAMALMDDSAAPALILSAEDANQDTLGFIIEGCNLNQALLQCIASRNIQAWLNQACDVLQVDNSCAILKVAEKTVKARLLIAADGVSSSVRKQLNIAVQQKSYEQTAIVANFEVKNAPEKIARQWFTHDAFAKNSILAWLPLPTVDNKHYISIVWSVSNESAQTLMQLADAEFAHEVSATGHAILGEMTLVTPRATFPLMLQKADTFYNGCAVLLGDAAHVIHPMAGQGMNLGFRDVIDLAKVLSEKNSYQQLSVKNLLNQYTRSRKADVLHMQLLTDGLFQLFENQNSVIKKVRQWGFAATKLQFIKKLLVANAIKQ